MENAEPIPAETTMPPFNSKEMDCIMCGRKMFYSQENLVHVCMEEGHGTLCYFEPDMCWFAASEKTCLELGKRGLKFHFIPKNVFENANLDSSQQQTFECEYSTFSSSNASREKK